MKPWIEVARPHKDVLEGTFQQSDFAADISRVANGTATPEYQNAENFFARTYVTEGMKQLLVTVARRLNGLGSEPVMELKTNFGGGKTHTLLAVYHLATYDGDSSNLQGVSDVLKAARVKDVPKAHVAVIDGNALAPNQPLKKGGRLINTLWGHLAWQLLGEKGYAMVADSDSAGTSPGKTILEALLKEAGPSVILMDELVCYYRQFNTTDKLTGGTYESNISFVQALSEAVKGVPQAILLVSLPSSDTEVAGTVGRLALETLETTFGRVNAIWRPVSAEEGFEIVKRRLFEKIEDVESVDETCSAFVEYYRSKREMFPTSVQDGTWGERMRKCYPIHPEVFSRLYEDWSTLPNFQKTRGVLQYMALVINRLWKDKTDEPLIMPASIPLFDTAIANKTTQFLPTGWSVILGLEIDGKDSRPARLDRDDARLGAINASVRAARSIFMGSAASSSAQTVRGVVEKQVFLACALPGQELSFYGDAIRKMREKLQYLFCQNERYWFDTRPNLSRTMMEYKSHIRLSEADGYLETIIKQRWGAPVGVAGFHVFEDHRDVPDNITDGIRVVVLPLSCAYSRATEGQTFQEARRYLEMNGASPRLRKNRLVFIAADLNSLGRLRDMCQTILAWREVREGITNGAINATIQERRQVEDQEHQNERILMGIVPEGFRYLIVPVQSGAADVGFEVRKVQTAAAEMMGDVVVRTLEQNEDIVRRWAPMFMKSTLEKLYFKNGVTEISTRRLWQDMASFYAFPRIVSPSAFCDTVSEGAAAGLFGYARAKGEDGSYLDFAFGSSPGQTGISETELLILDKAAEEYKNSHTAKCEEDDESDDEEESDSNEEGSCDGDDIMPDSGTASDPGEEGVPDGIVPPSEDSPLPTAAKRKFMGSVTVDVSNNTGALRQILDEVLVNMAGKGIRITVSLNIEATSVNPISAEVVRTVSENANTLGFSRAEFC